MSSGKGFVLLANDDPELTDDYLRPRKNQNNSSSRGRTPPIADDSADADTKNQHYLKRQHTLLKEWEVMKKGLFVRHEVTYETCQY